MAGKSCTTDGSGECSIGGILPPGTYWLHETGVPAGYTAAADQSGTLGLAQTVTLTFACVKSQLATLTLPQDAGCVKGVDADGSIVSGCTDTLWSITANAVDSVTQAGTTVNEGVAVRMLTADAATNCP